MRELDDLSPIPNVPAHVSRDTFGWEHISIEAEAQRPQLVVLSSTAKAGAVMGWPAYYKTVGLKPESSGLGELAKLAPGRLDPTPFVTVRREVAVRLNGAQQFLDQVTAGAVQLVAVDGFRRMTTQAALFSTYRNWVGRKNPKLIGDELDNLTRKMVSKPSTDIAILSTRPPHHTTGAAVDVVLVWKHLIEVNNDAWVEQAMINVGGDFDEMMHPIYADSRSSLRFTEENEVSEAERKMRRLLYWAMVEGGGFTPYHAEWFHFQIGNQLDAYTRGESVARYGFCGDAAEAFIEAESLRRAGNYAAELMRNGMEHRAALALSALDYGLEHRAAEIEINPVYFQRKAG